MPFIMNGKTPEQLLTWWECKVGLRTQEPPNWAMKLGTLLGEPIIDQYQEQSGDAITRRQEVVPSPVNDRFRSTLDGFSVSRNAVIEAKFVSPFFDRDQIFQTHYPQLAMQMHCTNADCGYLVVAQGTAEPFEIECVRSPAYEEVLLEEAAKMLESMDMLVPPVVIEVPVMVPPEKWRTVDLEDPETVNWGVELVEHILTYHDTKDAADAHDDAGKAAKALIPDDVGKVFVPGYTIARNKKGTLTITRRKA